MAPGDDEMGAVGDDPRLSESLRALQSLGDGPAPAPSPALAAFLATPTGAAAPAPAPGFSWLFKEKLARLSKAGKVVVIAGGIALGGTVSAAAAWQAGAVLPSGGIDHPEQQVPSPSASPA